MEVSKEFSISNFFVTITIGIHQVLTKVNTLFPVNFLENLEDFNEKVDDVLIELDGGYDVFFGGDASHTKTSSSHYRSSYEKYILFR